MRDYPDDIVTASRMRALSALRCSEIGLFGRSVLPGAAASSDLLAARCRSYCLLLSYGRLSLDAEQVSACLRAARAPGRILAEHAEAVAGASPDAAGWECMGHGPAPWPVRRLELDALAYRDVALAWKSVFGTGAFRPGPGGCGWSDKVLVARADRELGMSAVVAAVLSGVPVADAVAGLAPWNLG